MATAPTQPTPIDAAPKVPVLGDLAFDQDALAYTTWEATKLRPQANALGQLTYDNTVLAQAAAVGAAESLQGAQFSAAQAANSAVLAASGANAVPWTAATVWQPGTPTAAPSACYDPDNNPGQVYRYIGAVAQTTGRPKDEPTLWVVISALPSMTGQEGRFLSVAGGVLAWADVQAWALAVSVAADDGTDLMAATRYAVDSGTNRYLPAAPAAGFRVVLLNSGGLFGGTTWTLKRRDGAHTINGQASDVVFNYPAGVVSVEYVGAGKWVLA